MTHPTAASYRINPGLRLEREGDCVRFRSPTTELVCPPDAILLLRAFCPPRRLGDVPASPTLALLVEHGVLVPVDDGAPMVRESGFDAPELHARMLRDLARTRGFLDAIRAVVRPGDVVLDLGTGTGVLAIASAMAGARRVFAVEAGGIARLAERLASENRVRDRMEVVRGWSTAVELPEQCDVLVSETIGDEPLGERVLENVLDARRRLLSPGVRLVPSGLSIRVTLCEAPTAELSRRSLSREQLDRRARCLGLPAAALGSPTTPSSLAWKASWQDVAKWPKLAAPCTVTSVELTEHRSAQIDAVTEVEIECPGTLNVAAISAELQLAPGIVLATDRPDPTNSWQAFLVGLEPVRLDVGQRVRVRYTYGHRVPLVQVQVA